MIRHRRHRGHQREAAIHRRFGVGLALLAFLVQGFAPVLHGAPSAETWSLAGLEQPALCLAPPANRADDEVPRDGSRHDSDTICPVCPLAHQVGAYIPPRDAALVVPAFGASRIVWTVLAGAAADGPPIPGTARGPPLPA